MSEVLFLAHRIPFPPNRGDKIRSHHVLKALARLAPVHVATFADDEDDSEAEASLAAVAATYRVTRRFKPLAWAGVQALASGQPVSLPAFAHADLHHYIADTLRERPIAAVYVFSSQMAQYIPEEFAGRVVMDFVDVDSAKFEAYAARAAQPARTLYAREARLLAAWEATAARRASVSLFVSEAEAALFRSRLDAATRARVEVRGLGNGIDSVHFDPANVAPAPELASAEGPHLLFTGQMDYAPNVSAVVRFSRRVMPAILERHPSARFHIVGRRPSPAVAELDGMAGTRVWGRVDDMRPWLAAADLVVAPLEIARGIQNKVLEAMAMARPVLLSPEAAEGIAAREGEEWAIAADDDRFADKAFALLGDAAMRQRMGAAARAFVVERQSWPAMLSPLAELVGLAATGSRHAA